MRQPCLGQRERALSDRLYRCMQPEYQRQGLTDQASICAECAASILFSVVLQENGPY